MFNYPPAWISSRLSRQTEIIKLLWILLCLCAMSVMIKPAQAVETVPSIAAPVTVTGAWAWQDPYGNVPPSNISSLYGGYPTGQAVCDARSIYYPGKTILFVATGTPLSGGRSDFCALLTTTLPNANSSNVQGVAYPFYKLRCPATYVVSGALCAKTSTTIRLCPSVSYNQMDYTLDAGGLTCSRPTPACPTRQVPGKYGGCMLDCPAGSFPNLRNTACVANSCPIPPLTPLVDDATLGFEDGNRWQPSFLTPAYQTKLACVQNAITAKGWTYTGTSAYRPHPYQKHLLEVKQKDSQLDEVFMTNHPECQTLRDEITREMSAEPIGHGLQRGQDVAETISQHEKGQAFDITPHPNSTMSKDAIKTQMLPIYSACGVTNTKVKKEPWHVQ